jgi:hypothetical protein
LDKKPLIVSFYTKDTLYEKEAGDLIASLKKLDLEHEVVAAPNKGSWSANCCYKPEFLLEKLEEHKRPLIWTDADSVFMQRPTLLEDCHADVALRINDHVPVEDKAKMLTATFFINNTASAKKLLQLWKRECERLLARKGNELVFDQVALKKVVLHYPTIVEIKRLPRNYLLIVDTPEDKKVPQEEAVVVHYQASGSPQKMMEHELSPV